MININLLPEALRKKERMPLPQFLGVLAGVLLLGLVGYMIVKYQFAVIPELTNRRQSLLAQQTKLRAEAAELAEINGEIGRLSQIIDAVKSLYRGRRVWSKVLADIKNIVNFDATMSEVNPENRYLWLTRLQGDGPRISLSGYATAGDSRSQALQLPERLIEGFRTYAPTNLPEKDEEARLQDELRAATAAYEMLRVDNPDWPLQGPEEIQLRQRLAEIKAVKSGGLALKPFNDLLIPGSLALNSVVWSSTPRGVNMTNAAAVAEGYPMMGWSFSIGMNLK